MTKTFRDLGVDGAFCDALETQGITHPFPIQELTLPLALDGHDLIGQARTGTGKTLAFGLPLLQRLDSASPTTQALVIVPTRELCLQVYADLRIGETKGLTSVSVYGGVGYDEQIDALTSGAHVVVGTPGRLLDHLDRGNLDLSNVTELVLDEADEMLDMGFLADVERLVASCTQPDRHTMLFSATMPTAIVKLARRYMDHPTFTRADHETVETAPTVEQHFFQVHRMDKPRILARILQSPNRGGVYVFVRTKHMADRLVNELEALATPAIAIHGDLRQTTRERNLDRFRSGKATVLVATEVAARGLDVTGVTHVVNYDCPDDEKMYLHRIGRTARAGEAGVAVTFAEFNEADRLNVIRKAVGATDREVEQIFSTSERLTEIFDLPEQIPWGRTPRTGGRDGGRGRDEGRARREGGRSDGRPKNDRRTEGAGGAHDATRDRAERQPRERSSEVAEDATRKRAERQPDQPRERRSEVAEDATRNRAERQLRERSSDGRKRSSGGRERGAGEGEQSPTRTRTRSRTRARSRPATETTGRGERAGPRETQAEPPAPATASETAATEGGAEKRRRGSDRRRSESASGDTRKRRAPSRERASGTGGDRGARSGGGRGDSGVGRGGRGRRGQDGNREHRRQDAAPGKLERRGAEARGDGQPQLNRRVRVDHLP